MTATISSREADWSAWLRRRSDGAVGTAPFCRLSRRCQRAIFLPLEWIAPIADNDDMDGATPALFEQVRTFFRGIGQRQVRLACGLGLFRYLGSHFLNQALGNISLDAMAEGVYYHTLFWQFPPVAITLYGSALIHSSLGIWALYQRRQFSWAALEPLQLALGLSIPFLVVSHIVGVRLGQALFAQQKLYPQELYSFWVAYPL